MQIASAKPQSARGASHQPACVYPVYLVDELVLVFLVLLKEVRKLRWCKPRVTQGVVSFPSGLPRAGW